MNILFKLVIVFVGLVSPLLSVSAPPFPFEVEQPDGSKISVRMYGHEYYNWMETEDGYVIDWVEEDSRLGWFYNKLDEDGKFTSSEIFVTFPAPDDLYIPKHLREISPKVRDLSYRLPITGMDSHNHLDRGILDNTLKPLIFLVHFPDVDPTYTEEHFGHLLFSEDLTPSSANFPSGHDDYTMSVRDYYDEISNGKQEIIGDIGSVVPWRPATHNYSHYVDGVNGTGQGNGPEGTNNYDKSAGALVKEIAMAIDDEGFDLSQFDNGEGFIDVVILIVAGRGGPQTGNYFWPHMFVVHPNSDYFSVGGVNIYKYIVIQEQYAWNHSGTGIGMIHPIGTICHELGHVLGLPDLYDNSDSPAAGIGEWGLMGSGNYLRQTSPAYMSAWSRYRLGFIVPDTLTLANVYNLEITIPPAEGLDVGAAYILPMSSNLPQEYLMIENRQKIIGSSDEFLKKSGLLVWHIDETITDMYPVFSSSVNIDPQFYGVNLLQADGYGDLYTHNGDADSGDPFYGNAQITSSTYPNTNLYTYDRDSDGIRDGGGASNISLINIREENKTIILTAHNPNQSGLSVAYDEGGYEGRGFYGSHLMQWAGIQVVSPETSLLSGVRTVFPAFVDAEQPEQSFEVTDYVINVWKGWIENENKPDTLLCTKRGDVFWTERDGGWVHIYFTEENIILNEGDIYYVEINFNGSGGIYPFELGEYSNSQASGNSYYRGSNTNCTPLTEQVDGDWNIRVSLNPDFCNADCNGICNGTAEFDDCGICGGNDSTCLSITSQLIPDQFNLFQSYPNPFNPVTNITYGLPEHVYVQIIVYDLTGRKVQSLVNEFQMPGYHSVAWDASSYPSGVYLIRMDSGEFTQTQKVLLVK